MKRTAWTKAIIILFVGWLLAGCYQQFVIDSTNLPPATFPATLNASVDNAQTAQTDSSALSELGQIESTDHFTIHYPKEEQTSASYVGIVLEDNLERLCTALAHCPQQKIDVYIYPDLESFHEAIEYPDAPDWVVAAGWNDKIQMVSPHLISSNFIDKLIVHELVHVLQGQINPDAPFWMIEGIAMYEAGQSEGVAETVNRDIQANNIPTLQLFETLENEEAFAKAGGYEYAYTVVEFAVFTFDQGILAEWSKYPRDYEKVFGLSHEAFEKQWIDHLYEYYSP